MTQRLIISLLGLAWLAMYAWSFSSFWLDPTGDGFTRGLNRISTFVGWQFGAGMVGVALFALRNHVAPRLRKLLWVPVALALGLVALILVVIAWSWVHQWLNAPSAAYVPPTTTKP